MLNNNKNNSSHHIPNYSEKVEESLKNNKEYIENKIKELDTNINLLEVSGEYQNQNKIVESNLRFSRIKEIRGIKENLEKKLITVEEQISNLLDAEYNKEKKKLDIKSYLENFDKDKRECEKYVESWKSEMEKREAMQKERKIREEEKLLEMQEKIKEIQKEKLEKRKKEHKIISKKMHERNDKIKHEIADSLLKSDYKVQDKYLYNTMEKNYKERKSKYEETKSNELNKVLTDRKNFYSMRIRKSELDSHSEQVEALKKEKLLKMEKDRLLQFEQIRSENLKLEQRKEISKSYLDVLKIDNDIKHLDEKIKLDQLHSNLKVKKYSEFLKEHITIHTDELKKKELENRIERLNNPKSAVEHIQHHKKQCVKFVKFTEDSKRKYKWNIDLAKSIESIKNLSSRDSSPGSISDNNQRLLTEVHHTAIDIRKPLEKKPNYLTELKKDTNNDRLNTDMNLNQKYSKKWGKILSKIDNIYTSIDEVKHKTKFIEEKLHLKEKFLSIHKGQGITPEIGMEISNLLTNSIQAKLTLLDKINSGNY